VIRPASPADNLLGRLEGVRQRGPGQWSARCPAHADKSPSLAIKQRDDGAQLLHCHAGCSVEQIVGAIGMSVSDLFPPRPHQPGAGARPSKFKLPASQALEILNREALTIYVVGSDMHKQREIANTDFDRMAVAVRRIGQLVEASI